jgi:hypothetical protein
VFLFRNLSILTVVLLGLSAPAWAQDEGIRGELERVASTSPDEKVQYAAAATAEIQDAVAAVSKMLDQAERDGDAEKIECVQSRLKSLKALAHVTEAASVALSDALDASKSPIADHEVRKIAVAVAKTRQLRMEAEACVNESKSEEGTDTRDFTGPETADASDTEGVDDDIIDIGEDPPEVSPFQ